MMLSARNLSWKAGGRYIVEGVSLDVREDEFLGIIGPNGSGKSSLIAMLAGLRRPASGDVRLSGKPLRDMSPRQIARSIALVEQQAETTERLTARQAVELGRIPHLGAFTARTQDDARIVTHALEKVGMDGMADRHWHTLSGGERQRVHIARALAQEPRMLILDEPTNHLDISHQLSLLELVHGQPGLTIVAALHDLNHAAQFCNRLAVMQDGRLIALGDPKDVLTTELIARVFGVQVTIDDQGADGFHIRFSRQAARQRGVPDLRQAS